MNLNKLIYIPKIDYYKSFYQTCSKMSFHVITQKRTKESYLLHHLPTHLYPFFLLSREVQFFTQLHFSIPFFSVNSVNHGQPNRRRRFQLPFWLRKPPFLRSSCRSFAGGAEQPSHLPLRSLRRANLRHLLYLPSQPQPLQVNRSSSITTMYIYFCLVSSKHVYRNLSPLENTSLVLVIYFFEKS